MIPIAIPLDDIDFDGLLDAARSRLPALAPQWTDYNHHDPGIMLVELLAWLADSQIYALARDRHDERLAMLRLLGRCPRGAIPARGVVYPAATPAGVREVERGTVLKPGRGSMPRLESDCAITLLPVVLRRLSTTWGLDGVTDHTEVNARPRAVFLPFGDDGKGELRIELDQTAAVPDGEKVRLSLGFRIEGDAGGPIDPRIGRVRAFHPDGTPIVRLHDTTFSLQRSGTMVFRLDPRRVGQAIMLRPSPGYAIIPQLLQVLPNALPVAQQASFEQTDWRGNGRSGQARTFVPRELFPSDEQGGEETGERVWRLVEGAASLGVEVEHAGEMQRWARGDLDAADPGDMRYAADEAGDGSGVAVRFGNGINGYRPAQDAAIRVRMVLSCGADGNAGQPADWIDSTGTAWRNPDPIAGGREAEDVTAALAALREDLRRDRTLLTSSQLAKAASVLPAALGIARVQVENGWERGRRSPASAATRTLIAVHRSPGAERAAWLQKIRRRLAPHVAIGERLLVVAPRYRRFSLTIEVTALAGRDRAAVRVEIAAMLKAKLSNPELPWPFARDVDAATIAGWLLRVEGVAAVSKVTLSGEGARDDRIAVGRGELPLFEGEPAITIHEAAS